MDYRPWFIIILAVFVALSPVQNILMFSTAYDQSLIEFLADVHRFQTGPQLAVFYLLPLVAGYSIFAVKNWSFPVFVVAFTYYMYQTYMTGTFPVVFNDLSLMSACLLINVALVAYFLLPTVRAAYFDASVRWWEAKYRYKIEMDAVFTSNDRQVTGKISDISEGGIFVTTDGPLDNDCDLSIRFKYHTLDFQMHGKVVREQNDEANASGHEHGYGIEFNECPREYQKRLKKLIRALELLEVPRRPKRRDWESDFVGWLLQLITSGRGITPDLPARYLRRKG
jgi:hypothetical protein